MKKILLLIPLFFIIYAIIEDRFASNSIYIYINNSQDLNLEIMIDAYKKDGSFFKNIVINSGEESCMSGVLIYNYAFEAYTYDVQIKNNNHIIRKSLLASSTPYRERGVHHVYFEVLKNNELDDKMYVDFDPNPVFPGFFDDRCKIL